MSFFKKSKPFGAASRLADEALYARALHEVESCYRRDGLWGKALANSGGDERRAKSLYLEYLVQALRDEDEMIAAEQAVHDEKPKRDLTEDWIHILVGFIAIIILASIFLSK